MNFKKNYKIFSKYLKSKKNIFTLENPIAIINNKKFDNLRNNINLKYLNISKIKINLEKRIKEYFFDKKILKSNSFIKFIGIYFSENNLIISNIQKRENYLEIKKTVQIEIPGDIVGEYKVEDVEGLSKIIEDIISIYNLQNIPIILFLGSAFFKCDTFSKDSILIAEDKLKIISSKSPFLQKDTQFLIKEVEGDKYSNYTRVIYSNKEIIESWIQVLTKINNPLVTLTNGILPILEFLSNKNRLNLLIEVNSFNTTIYYIKENCELISYNLPYGGKIYASDKIGVKTQYFTRLDKSIKDILKKINQIKISAVYITGAGLSKVYFSGEKLPFNLKLLDIEFIDKYFYQNKENNFNYLFNQYSQTLLSNNNYCFNFLEQYENLNIWDQQKTNKNNIFEENIYNDFKKNFFLLKKKKIIYYPSLSILGLTVLIWVFSSINIFNVIWLKENHERYLANTNKLQMTVQSLNSNINKVVNHSKFYTSSLDGFLFGKFLEASVPEGIQITKLAVNKDIFSISLNSRNLEIVNQFITLIRSNPIINESQLKITTLNSIENQKVINSSTISNNKFYLAISGKLNNLSLDNRIKSNINFDNNGKVYKLNIFAKIRNIITEK